MTQEAPDGGVLETAIQRLDRAMGQLERRLETLSAEAKGANGELFDLDRAKLAAELDAARARERDLEAAGSQASAALGRAIAEIRSALGDEPAPGGQAKEA